MRSIMKFGTSIRLDVTELISDCVNDHQYELWSVACDQGQPFDVLV